MVSCVLQRLLYTSSRAGISAYPLTEPYLKLSLHTALVG